MEVIPVIDLKGGAVVRARLGQRDAYAPIKTPLAADQRAERHRSGVFERFIPFARSISPISTPSSGAAIMAKVLRALSAAFPE